MPDFIPRKGQNPVDVFTALFQPVAKLTGNYTLNKDGVVASFIYRSTEGNFQSKFFSVERRRMKLC